MVKLADYSFYTEEYLGSMAENDFNKAVVQASAYLVAVTFDRALAVTDEEINKKIKWCCCEICDLINAANVATIEGAPVKSVSNDGYSVNYITEADGSAGSLNSKMLDLAIIYLPAELLYKGV